MTDPYAATSGATPVDPVGAPGYAGTTGTTGSTGTSSGYGTAAGPDERPSLGTLLSEVTADLSTLFRQEVALAKAEAAQSAKKAGKGAGLLSGAGVAGHFVLLFLSLALMFALSDLFGEPDDNLGIAALIVAVLWGVVAAILALKGKKEVQEVQGLPKTADTVKKIPPALKGHEEENR